MCVYVLITIIVILIIMISVILSFRPLGEDDVRWATIISIFYIRPLGDNNIRPLGVLGEDDVRWATLRMIMILNVAHMILSMVDYDSITPAPRRGRRPLGRPPPRTRPAITGIYIYL